MVNTISRIAKAAVALLAVVGIQVSPENADTITQAALAIYAIASGAQATSSAKTKTKE